MKLHRFIWFDDEKTILISPFIHTFMFTMASVGICFALFPDATESKDSLLYQLTSAQTSESTTNVWGWAALSVPILAAISLQFHTRALAATVAMLGFMVWFFAAITYVMGGFIFGVLVVAIPNLMFWVWLYFQTEAYFKGNYDSEKEQA